MSPKKIKKFKDRVREITRRNRGVSMRARVVELRRYLQGWVGSPPHARVFLATVATSTHADS